MLLALSYNSIISQNTFSKSYNVLILESQNDLGEIKGGYLVSQRAFCEDGGGCNGILRLDKQGNIVLLDSIRQETNLGLFQFQRVVSSTKEDEFVVGGVKYDNPYYGFSCLAKLDKNLDTIWTHRLDRKEGVHRLREYKDKSILMFTYNYDETDTTYNNYVIRFDSLGNILWRRLLKLNGYPNLLYGNFTADIQVAEDGSILTSLGGKRKDSIDFGTSIHWIPITGSLVWRLDSLGQTLDSAQYWSNRDYYFDETIDIALLPNNGVALSYTYEDNLPGDRQVILGLDKNLDEKWRYSFVKEQYLSLFRIIPCKNGDIVGIANNHIDGDNHLYRPWLFRMSPDGVLKWSRWVRDTSFVGLRPTETQSDYWENALEDEDGYLVISGSQDFYPAYTPTNLWVIKLDSMGCMLPGCQDSVLYLNSTVAVDEPGQPLVGRQVWFSIAPNPASDYFEMRFFEALPYRNARVEVLSESGRAVFSEPLAVGISSKKIECGDWPPGVYFISFSENGRTFQTEKVVVAHR